MMDDVTIFADAITPAADNASAPQQAQAVEAVPADVPAGVDEQAQPQGLFGGGMSTILIYVLLFAGLWFLLFMPQRKRQKALQKLQSELKVGDTVYTTSGIVGKIVSIDEQTATLQVSEGTRIPFLRNSVVGLANNNAPAHR